MIILVDVYIDTAQSIALNEVDVKVSLSDLDVEKALFTDIWAVTTVVDEDGNKYSKIIISEDLTFYSPTSAEEIYKMIKEDNTIWQRKN